MSAPDRGVCTETGKARFTHAEAIDKVRRGKRRGNVMTLYRCAHCDGWWHTTHANDGGGGGVRRHKQHRPTAAVRRAKSNRKRKR